MTAAERAAAETAPAWAPGALLREGWRYFGVSVAALAVDYGLLVGLTELAHFYFLVSAAIAFAAGLAVNYALSIAFVFRQHSLKNRWLEFAGFVAVGLVGLALNEGLMKLFVETAGLGYALAKVPATGIGFVFNFGARKALLFSRAT